MSNLPASRRQVIASLAVLPAAALPVATIAAASAPDRTEWETALAAFQRIKAESAAFDGPYLDTWDRCRAACEAVPHVTFPPEAYTGGRCQTTADAWEVRQARRDVAALDAGKMHLDPLPGLREHYAIKRELVKAADQREAAIQAIRDRFGMDALDERSEALGEAESAALGVVFDTPAPDLAALRWKLDYMTEEARESEGSLPCYSAEFVRQTIADIARLLPKGA